MKNFQQLHLFSAVVKTKGLCGKRMQRAQNRISKMVQILQRGRKRVVSQLSRRQRRNQKVKTLEQRRGNHSRDVCVFIRTKTVLVGQGSAMLCFRSQSALKKTQTQLLPYTNTHPNMYMQTHVSICICDFKRKVWHKYT